MKKIFLMAYARKNLGDDLFIKILLERYPKHNFYMMIDDSKYLSMFEEKYNNLHILKGKDTDISLNNINIEAYDAYIYIGGSIFMEGGIVYNLSNTFYNFTKKCREYNRPFFYISSNYGPYKTKEYFELSRKNFNIVTDICFRDKYSYNLFKDIQTVRYAPDYAFTYSMFNNEKIPNSVGITIIDLGVRNNLKNKENEYVNMLVNNINNYLKNGKKVYLFTFCAHEEDERTLNIILSKVNNNNVFDIRYNGNIDEFIKKYSQIEYMICSRFHAIILSMLAKQNIQVVSYSNKINNVIQDLELGIPIINLNEINAKTYLNLDGFSTIDNEKLNNIIYDSYRQEEKIREILE